MSHSDSELLEQYARHQAEDAFAEIVRRHIGLVYSAALRQVRSPQLAEEIVQSTFLKLAHHANRLAPTTILASWLYQITRNEAVDVVRREARRHSREQIATELNAMNATTADWEHVEPILDEAMHTLDETDRAAVLLRYFENKSLREVGDALGTSDDAAQKRVSRAVDRLREFFSRRGVTVGASSLVVLLSGNAIQAVPVGLAIATATTATGLSAIASTTKVIAMTTLQKTIVGATLAVAIGIGVYQVSQNIQIRAQAKALQEQQSPLLEQIRQLEQEKSTASNQLAAYADQVARWERNSADLLKLRSEVGLLRQSTNELARKNNQDKASPSPEVSFPPPSTNILQDSYPKESLSFAGYAEPELAFRSFVWGGHNGLEAMMQGVSPRMQEGMQEMLKGMSESEVAALLARKAATIKEYRISGLKVVSNDKVVFNIVTIHKDGKQESEKMGFIRFGNEWKADKFDETWAVK